MTRQVYQWKVRLNVYGGQQEYGVTYLETYSPVVTWFSIRTILTLAVINKWHSIQVDFIQAYPQVPIEYDLFVDFTKGFKTKEGDGWNHVLQILKNLYRHKKSGRVCKHHLNNALRAIWFKQSAVNECVWYRYETIFFYCVNVGIFMGPDHRAIDKSIKDIEKAGLDIEDKGDIEYYLGVNIEDQDNGKIRLMKPQIIEIIINDIHLPKNIVPQQTPALSTNIIWRDTAAPPFDEHFKN